MGKVSLPLPLTLYFTRASGSRRCQILFGWFWFIPAFATLLHPPGADGHVRFVLGRKEVDFPLGVGAALVDVEIVLADA
jgi:hypothetical protein